MTISDSDFRLFIGDDRVDGGNGTYEIVNPATEQVVAEAPDASASDAEDAAHSAAEAFPAWSQTPPEERAALLDRTADLLEARSEELFPLVQAETGATMRVTTTMQVPQAIIRMRRYAKGRSSRTRCRCHPASRRPPLAPGG